MRYRPAHVHALSREEQTGRVEGLLSDDSAGTPGLSGSEKSNECVFSCRKHLCRVMWKHTLHTETT